MKTRQLLYGQLLLILLIGFFTSCKKDKDEAPLTPTISLKLYMTDYYPDSFYHNYATLNVTNDSNYLYLSFDSLNAFQFKNIKLVIGDLKHLQTVLTPYTTPPVSDVGPASFDKSENFATPVYTYKVQIPRSSLNSRKVYLYAWARMEKYRSDGTLADWHGAWANSDNKVNGDAATSYFQFNF